VDADHVLGFLSGGKELLLGGWVKHDHRGRIDVSVQPGVVQKASISGVEDSDRPVNTVGRRGAWARFVLCVGCRKHTPKLTRSCEYGDHRIVSVPYGNRERDNCVAGRTTLKGE